MAALEEGRSSMKLRLWIAWTRSYFKRVDPFRTQIGDEAPAPLPEDLAPFLGGLSPYRPSGRSAGRRRKVHHIVGLDLSRCNQSRSR